MITLIACPNGFGHFFRLLDLAKYLNKKNKVILICSKKQLKKIEANKIKKIKFLPILKDCNLNYGTYKKLNKFYDINFEKFKEVQDSKIIISDNLINKIYKRKNFFLIANFLWSKIYDDNSLEKKAYLNKEKEFILTNKKNVFQNKYFGMPLGFKTKKLYFFGKKSNSYKKEINYSNLNTLIYLSNNDEIDINILSCIKKFSHIFVNKKNKIIKKNKNIKIISDYDMQKVNCDFLLSKPGLGSITDAIKKKVGLLLINTSYNKEFKFNATKIEKFGIGIKLNKKNFKRKLNDFLTNRKKINNSFFKKFKFLGEKKIEKAIFK